jgi:hypothetical protein
VISLDKNLRFSPSFSSPDSPSLRVNFELYLKSSEFKGIAFAWPLDRNIVFACAISFYLD